VLESKECVKDIFRGVSWHGLIEPRMGKEGDCNTVVTWESQSPENIRRDTRQGVELAA
jgi:hypothetical protein